MTDQTEKANPFLVGIGVTVAMAISLAPPVLIILGVLYLIRACNG